MNIWIFNHYAISPEMPGGTRHFDFSKELVKRGHTVTIFASSFNYYKRVETKLFNNEKWKIENIDGINFVWLKTYPYQRNDWKRVLNMVSYMLRAYSLGRKLLKINKNIKKPDVIIGSSVHLLAVLSAYFLSKFYKCKFVMEVRDLWPQTLIDLGKISKKKPIIFLLHFLEKFLYQHAEKIITLLPFAHEYITSCGVPKEKIVWIPNGVNLSKYTELMKPINKDDKFKIMYFGVHGKANSLDVILKAAKIIQDKKNQKIEFVLVGDGPEKPRLISLGKELDLKNIEFRNMIPKNEISKAMDEADAFVFNLEDSPVFKYGISSNKLFDYLSANRPVIFSCNSSNNPVSEAKAGITIPPQNPSAMADAIIELFSLPLEQRIQMGKNGLEYVKKHHDIRILVDRLENLLLRLL